MILLFIFYKKFIANNDISLLGENGSSGKNGEEDMEHLYDEFDSRSEHTKLRAKVKSQILSNLDGLSAEESAKYEVLIEQIEKSVNEHPNDIAQMILMLLNEGDTKLKS